MRGWIKRDNVTFLAMRLVFKTKKNKADAVGNNKRHLIRRNEALRRRKATIRAENWNIFWHISMHKESDKDTEVSPRRSYNVILQNTR